MFYYTIPRIQTHIYTHTYNIAPVRWRAMSRTTRVLAFWGEGAFEWDVLLHHTTNIHTHIYTHTYNIAPVRWRAMSQTTRIVAFRGEGAFRRNILLHHTANTHTYQCIHTYNYASTRWRAMSRTTRFLAFKVKGAFLWRVARFSSQTRISEENRRTCLQSCHILYIHVWGGYD